MWSRLRNTLAIAAILALAPLSAASAEEQPRLQFGELGMDPSGYPDRNSLEPLLDEIAYHGATQAYLWGVPILANYAWASEQRRLEGPLTFITYDSVAEKRGILTSNMVTPYLLAFPNLRDTGPLVIEIPAGATGGIMNDFMMRNITDTGVVGPDAGRGGKYLVLHESWPEPEKHDADYIVRSKTWNFWAGSRILDTDPAAIDRIRAAHRIYPLSDEVETRIVPIGTREYRGWQPDGIAYWQMLHEVIQLEDFAGEFPLIMQYLARVGIEKGKPFAPDERQKAILLRAEAVGKQMATALSAGRNLTRAPFYDDGTQWSVHLGGLSNAQHKSPLTGMYELDGLVSYTWEAFAMSDGMMQPTVGRGSKYLAAYADSEGRWLDGSYTYRLTVPANVPARQFWSMIVYSRETRVFIENRDGKPGVSSRDDPLTNRDGSVTLTIGPDLPKGAPARNHIYTPPGQGWFTYFRFYAPGEAYFDKSWRLPDIERAERDGPNP